MKLSHLLQDKRTCIVTVGDEQVTVVYRPSGYTTELEDKLRECISENRGGAALVELLARCVVKWDILDDDGNEIPATPEALRRLPTLFLSQVAQAITEDMRPNLASGGNSAAG